MNVAWHGNREEGKVREQLAQADGEVSLAGRLRKERRCK